MSIFFKDESICYDIVIIYACESCKDKYNFKICILSKKGGKKGTTLRSSFGQLLNCTYMDGFLSVDESKIGWF